MTVPKEDMIKHVENRYDDSIIFVFYEAFFVFVAIEKEEKGDEHKKKQDGKLLSENLFGEFSVGTEFFHIKGGDNASLRNKNISLANDVAREFLFKGCLDALFSCGFIEFSTGLKDGQKDFCHGFVEKLIFTMEELLNSLEKKAFVWWGEYDSGNREGFGFCGGNKIDESIGCWFECTDKEIVFIEKGKGKEETVFIACDEKTIAQDKFFY